MRRTRTATLERLSRRDLERSALDFPRSEHPHAGAGRPQTWGECREAGLGMPSHPCPWVSCAYHLELDAQVSPSGAPSLKSRRPRADLRVVWDVVPARPEHTCALAHAETHPDGVTLEEVAEVYGLSRERARQIENRALAQILPRLLEAGVSADDVRALISAADADDREAHCGTARAPDQRDLRAVRFSQPEPVARVEWRAPRPQDSRLRDDPDYLALVARNARALDPRPTVARGVVSCGPALPTHAPRWAHAPEDLGVPSQHPADEADEALTAQETAR